MNNTEWEAMKNINIMTVDPSALVDIQDVKIDINLSKKDRIADYIKQIRNPYCYKCGKIIIKTNYPNTGRRVADIMKSIQ